MSTTLPSGNIISTTTYGGEEYQNINVTFTAGGIQAPVSIDNPFPTISGNEDTIVMLLTRILGALGRVNSQGQLAVNMTETTPTVNIAASQTLSVVSQVEKFGNSGRPIDAIPAHISNAGVTILYDNLKVS